MVDQAFASQVQGMFEQDFAPAEIIDLDALDRKPFWWRFGVGLSRLAARCF
jgi:hypothetical protein